MATRELSLFADLDQGRLVQSFSSTLQAILPRFVFGDSVPISFRPLKSNGANSASPWSEVDLTGKTVRIAIGNPAGVPSGGTFSLSYDGDTTTPIAFDATGAQIASAMNALTSIISAGGVTVTKSTTGAFRVVFAIIGTREVITADTSSLYPSSGAEIRVAATGDATTREIAVIRLESLPAAYAELTDTFPVAAATITETRTGSASVGAILSLGFPVIPFSGFYTLEIGGEQTAGIPWDGDATVVESALDLLSTVGAGMVSVSGEFPLFAISFDLSLGDIGAMTADLSGLVVPQGRSGSLSTNTAQMIELMNGSSQATAKLEIELYDISDATTWTVLQTDCTVIDDVIGNAAASVTGGPSYVTTETLDNLPTPAALTFAGADPNDSVDGLTISGIVTPSAANGFYAKGADANGYPTYARAGYRIFRATISYTWILTTDTLPFSANKFVTNQNVATPDLVTEWTPISGNEGELDISLVASLTGTHLGQLCKASTAWWIWNGTAWIPWATLNGSPVAYNATLGSYRKLTVSGASGSETIAVSAL